MNEKKLSQLQKEYRTFFLEKMTVYGVHSPAALAKVKKSQFFNEIKQDWATYKLSKKILKDSSKTGIENVVEENEESYKVLSTGELEEQVRVQKGNKKESSQQTIKERIDQHFVALPEVQEQLAHLFTKQIIKSRPNPDQKDDLTILFKPNIHFAQEGQNRYPVVMMPKENSGLKLPRAGRSNQKGYKEKDFYSQLKLNLVNIEIANDVHMVIPHFSKPYEPDIVLFDKELNLYIDIEIDEPYDGYYRYPTHYINPEDEVKQDYIRDLFFNESGWIVIRFTEKQVHCETNDCIEYIKNVIKSIYDLEFTNEVKCEKEDQWDYNQCIQWQKLYYREKYLGIERFQKQYSYTEIDIDTEESETIEKVIKRTKNYSSDKWNNSIAFDEEAHKYLHPKDQTGNAEFISVTTLIERFFPFDLKRYIERKAEEENRTEDDVLDEYFLVRDEASEKGTFLHKQIENFLKQKEFVSDTKEFALFLKFYNKEIKERNLTFYDAEKMIVSNQYNVAGTIDCLFKKNDTDEYVMLDWKRSKKLIIDGCPRIFGYGYALSELNTLDNSSYNKYCLQQNIYKDIVETEYSLKISSMKLVVLHENYFDYHIVPVPIMKKEAKTILNSLKVKI